MPERNPYLIIGIDFAASRDQARRAFARAARRVRQDGGAWATEDLTWALHEIDALEQDPAELVSLYRVPANPSIYEPGGPGLFQPPPITLERRTAADDPEALTSVREAATRELEELLATALGALAPTLEMAYDLEGGRDETT